MKDSVCRKNLTIREVLKFVNAEPAGIAFVVDESDKLCGVVTDGDIRRMLLNGRELNDVITDNLLGNFVYATEGQSIDQLLKGIDKKVRIIPIVSHEGKLIDYFRYEHKTHFTPVAEPSLKGNELNYVTDAVLSTWISSSGEYITRFENNFSGYCGSSYGVAVSNGTVAIHLALLALDIGAGDEVIVPDLTFAATINTVLHARATPVIVDIEETSWCIDPKRIKEAITPKTKAIIPVHVYGQACDMDAIMAIAKEHNLYVIEDAAEAHGAAYKGKKVGSIGDIGTFSFYGNKIITTGEGGMCITNNAELDDKMRVLRDHGMSKTKRYWHELVGYNYRMTNIQAAIGCAQLERIEEILKSRKEIEKKYKKHLTNLFDWQADINDRERVVWLVSALYNGDKELLFKKLKDHSIDIRPFFYCLSDMPLYEQYAKECVVSKSLSQKGVNLPTVEGLDYGNINSLIGSI